MYFPEQDPDGPKLRTRGRDTTSRYSTSTTKKSDSSRKVFASNDAEMFSESLDSPAFDSYWMTENADLARKYNLSDAWKKFSAGAKQSERVAKLKDEYNKKMESFGGKLPEDLKPKAQKMYTDAKALGKTEARNVDEFVSMGLKDPASPVSSLLKQRALQEVFKDAGIKASPNDGISPDDNLAKAANYQVRREFQSVVSNPEAFQKFVSENKIGAPPAFDTPAGLEYARQIAPGDERIQKMVMDQKVGRRYNVIDKDGKLNPEFARQFARYAAAKKSGAKIEDDYDFSEYLKDQFGSDGPEAIKKMQGMISEMQGKNVNAKNLAKQAVAAGFNTQLAGLGMEQMKKADQPVDMPAPPPVRSRNMLLQDRIAQEQANMNQGMSPDQANLLNAQQQAAYNAGLQNIQNMSSGQSGIVGSQIQNLSLNRMQQQLQNQLANSQLRQQAAGRLDNLLGLQQTENNLINEDMAKKFYNYDLPMLNRSLDARARLGQAGLQNVLSGGRGITQNIIDSFGKDVAPPNYFGEQVMTSDAMRKNPSPNQLGVVPTTGALQNKLIPPSSSDIPQDQGLKMPPGRFGIFPVDTDYSTAPSSIMPQSNPLPKYGNGGLVPINIEGGELLSTPQGVVVKEFSAPPHPRNGINPAGNREVPEGYFIIPKSDAERFQNMKLSERQKYLESLPNSGRKMSKGGKVRRRPLKVQPNHVFL
jgi:hypothetical protein